MILKDLIDALTHVHQRLDAGPSRADVGLGALGRALEGVLGMSGWERLGKHRYEIESVGFLVGANKAHQRIWLIDTAETKSTLGVYKMDPEDAEVLAKRLIQAAGIARGDFDLDDVVKNHQFKSRSSMTDCTCEGMSGRSSRCPIHGFEETEHAPLPDSAEAREAMKPFISATSRNDRKIQAMKEIRDLTNWDLKTAKEFFDHHCDSIRREKYTKYTSTPMLLDETITSLEIELYGPTVVIDGRWHKNMHALSHLYAARELLNRG